MKLEDCFDKIKNNNDELIKLKNQLDLQINANNVIKINKKYIRLLEKKDDILKNEIKHEHEKPTDPCNSDVSDITGSSVDSDKFWARAKTENKPQLLLKIEKQLCATLVSYKFEKNKCNIASYDSSGIQIGFGNDIYDQYLSLYPNQLYFFDLSIVIQLLGQEIKIINKSTADSLIGEYTQYYINSDLIDSRIFFGNCAHDELAITKLHRKLKHSKHISCEYEDFIEALTSIIKSFPRLLGFKECEVGFTEKIECI